VTRLVVAPGVIHWPGYLAADQQASLVADLREAARQAPFFHPRMPRTGRPFSVRMTNLGPLGWVSDVDGYRYQPLHPETGQPWPQLPGVLLDAWNALAGYPHPPEACLVNFYEASAKMGLHQDRDEADLEAPVVSVSLGATCLFRVGQPQRGGPTVSFKLASGDIVVLGGGSSVGERDVVIDAVAARGEVIFHGIAVKPGKPTLFARIARPAPLGGHQLVFGMPGNPTSCLSQAHVLLVPALRLLAGLPPLDPPRVRRRLASAVGSPANRHQFLPVRIEGDLAVPTFKGSGEITSLSQADGYVEIPLGVARLEEGTEVEVVGYE
jgi:alkylated DNA repair protein (DNA oxidative demethylase)